MASSSGAAGVAGSEPPIVSIAGITHRYGKVTALDDISLDVPRGLMVGVIGPDGVGKSTLLGLIAGSRKLQSGTLTVLDGDMASREHRRAVCPRIAYMPQGLGKNLYLELSVYDNIDFMAELFGLSVEARQARVHELLEATGLAPFPDRPAGKLSGGMKQKVGLCGALVHDPDLLILDEPTTGVDPLSRRQFWALIADIRSRRAGMSVMVATAYMDEAEQWDWIVAMDAGRVLATGSPRELMQRTGTTNLEAAFVSVLPAEKRKGHVELVIPPRVDTKGEIAIESHGLTRRFGNFTAVDHVTMAIERGEIFGFLGSNGCGKSTTMKMLTGLLPPTEGSATVFGQSVEAGSLEVRNNLGYMTQAFSLYEELTVRANLVLDAKLYHLPREEADKRIDALVKRFGLGPHLDAVCGELPLGLKQRLSLAVAVLHNPKLLILDEPTSGVDPVARDSFWELLIDLSRKEGVTIFVTTHFMNEGMRCDKIALMHAGRVLAYDDPQKLIETRGKKTLEEAFIAYIEDEIAATTVPSTTDKAAGAATAPPARTRRFAPPSWLGRTLAYARNEAIQIVRDPVRLTFAFAGSALLMLVFGFGITTDVEHIRYAAFDRDQTPESRAYLERFRGTPTYFRIRPPIHDDVTALKRLQSDDISFYLEMPSNFGRDLRKGSKPDVLAHVDGANPFRAETVAGYVRGVNLTTAQDPGSGLPQPSAKRPRLIPFQDRYMYNPTFKSIYSIVPDVPAILLILIPAILMTVAIVREKELGSIINFYVTPTRKIEFLLGKQLPYICIGLLNFFILAFISLTVFRVPIKGSFLMLSLCTLLYVMVTTAMGMVTSTITKTQVAAVFLTVILTMQPSVQFSGMLQPVSTLDGGARAIGLVWPTSYYIHASLGAYTKGIAPSLMVRDVVVLLCTYPILLVVSVLGMRKQEK